MKDTLTIVVPIDTPDDMPLVMVEAGVRDAADQAVEAAFRELRTQQDDHAAE